MEVPVKNQVETVDLTPEDFLLTLLECVVNPIISLQQSTLPKSQRKIQMPGGATMEFLFHPPCIL